MFKLRCSAIGQIMPSTKARVDFTQTHIDWIKKRIIEEKYSRKEQIKSDFIDKGIECEENSFTLACKVLKLGFVQKNQEFMQNDYITGTPDLIYKDTVIDIKSSWNIFTFPFFEKELPNTDYYWQLQGYMALTGLKKAQVIYCLVDTPDNLIINEAYRMARSRGKLLEEVEDEARSLHTFSDIPEQDRIKVFNVEYNEADQIRIQNRVEEIRKFIKNNYE